MVFMEMVVIFLVNVASFFNSFRFFLSIVSAVLWICNRLILVPQVFLRLISKLFRLAT